MTKQQLTTFKRNRLEERVRGYANIYKVWQWDEAKGRYIDPKDIPYNLQKAYHARKRIKILGKCIRMSRYFDSIEAARAWQQVSESDEQALSNYTTLNEPKQAYLFRHLLVDWRNYTKPPRLRESTWQVYDKHVQHMNALHEVEVEKLNAGDIDAWLRIVIHDTYPKKPSRQTYLHELKTLGSILRWYREYKNPSYAIPVLKRHFRDACYTEKKLKETKMLTAIELEQFLSVLRSYVSPVYFYLAAFQALTGARIGEACGLKWDCVNLEEEWVTIKRIVWWDYKDRAPHLREGTKTDTVRRIRMCRRLKQLMMEWKLKSGNRDMVFHRSGDLLKYSSIQRAYNDAFEKIGVPFRSTHILRHTFATLFVSQTQNREALRSILGHTSFAMTERYAHRTEQTQLDAMGAFELGKQIAK